MTEFYQAGPDDGFNFLTLLESFPQSHKFVNEEKILREPYRETVGWEEATYASVSSGDVEDYKGDFGDGIVKEDHKLLDEQFNQAFEMFISHPLVEQHEHNTTESKLSIDLEPEIPAAQGAHNIIKEETPKASEKQNNGEKKKTTRKRRSKKSKAPLTEEEKLELEKKKKLYVNAACRRSRLKRKLERENLNRRNDYLEREREEFQEKILQLHSTLKTLQDARTRSPSIDPQTENLLLRAEVKRHKTLVDHLRTITNGDTGYSLAEKLTTADQVAKSSIAQIVGMLYTSMVDKTWHFHESEYNFEFFETKKILVRHQFLPYGSTKETAKWINIRVDILDIPIPHLILDTVLHNFTLDTSNKANLAKAFIHGEDAWEKDDTRTREYDIDVIALNPEEEAVFDEATEETMIIPRMLRYREIIKNAQNGETECTYESIFTQAHSREILKKSGFHESENINADYEEETLPASVFTTVGAPAKLLQTVSGKLEDKRGIKQVGGDIVKGGLITPASTFGHSNATILLSTPLTDSELFMSDRKFVADFAGGVPGYCKPGFDFLDEILLQSQEQLAMAGFQGFGHEEEGIEVD